MSSAWMPLYVKDYLADTGHLSTLEHGAYLLLIMHYWQTGSLPSSASQLARICRLTLDEWNHVAPALQEFFSANWRHKRIERELEASKRILENRRQAGKLGGKARADAVAKAKQKPSDAMPQRSVASATVLLEQNASQSQAHIEEPFSLRSNGAAHADADPRARLFREGLSDLAQLTGRPESKLRSIIGRWLRDCDDDALRVSNLIDKAKRDRPADPIPWIERHIHRSSTGPPTAAQEPPRRHPRQGF